MAGIIKKCLSKLSEAGLMVFSGYEIGKNANVEVKEPIVVEPKIVKQATEEHLDLLYVVIVLLIVLIFAIVVLHLYCTKGKRQPIPQAPIPLRTL